MLFANLLLFQKRMNSIFLINMLNIYFHLNLYLVEFVFTGRDAGGETDATIRGGVSQVLCLLL